MSYDIRIRELSEQPAGSVGSVVSVDAIPRFLGTAFVAVARAAEAAGIEIDGPPFGRFLPLPDGSWHIEAGFPLARDIDPAGPVMPTSLPAGTCASTIHLGGYDTIESAYIALTDWITENHWATTGQAWESYLDEPGAELPRTEVFMPVFRPDTN